MVIIVVIVFLVENIIGSRMCSVLDEGERRRKERKERQNKTKKDNVKDMNEERFLKRNDSFSNLKNAS